MPKFSVSLWATFEANNWEDANRKADQIEVALFNNDEVSVEDTGIIDVECSDDECDEEPEWQDDSNYENIDRG